MFCVIPHRNESLQPGSAFRSIAGTLRSKGSAFDLGTQHRPVDDVRFGSKLTSQRRAPLVRFVPEADMAAMRLREAATLSTIKGAKDKLPSLVTPSTANSSTRPQS
jgi:hypothetical protein